MKLVILGAHSEAGRTLSEAIEACEWPIELVRATTTAHLESDLNLIDESTLRNADMVFLTFADDFTDQLVRVASKLSVPMIDLTGRYRADAQLLCPPFEESSLLSAGLYRVPLGFAYPIAAVLKALGESSPIFASVVTFEGAAASGLEGIEELSEQTRGVFTQQSTDPKVFYAPSAFNVLPSVGQVEDPFGPDSELAEDILSLLSASEPTLSVMRTQVPVFTAEGAALTIELTTPMELTTIENCLDGVPGLQFGGEPGRTTLEAVDTEGVQVTRLRSVGRHLTAWLSADRLQHGLAWPAVALAQELVSRGKKTAEPITLNGSARDRMS